MLKSPIHLSNSELFEDLNDQFSEKISGGTSTIEGPLVDLIDFPFTNSVLNLLNPNLQTTIDQQLKALFPEGISNTAALACRTDENGQLVCEVSADGSESQSFVVPL